jgi:hypothetical protein
VKVIPRGSEKFRAKIWKDKFNFIFLGGVRNKVKKGLWKEGEIVMLGFLRDVFYFVMGLI